MRSSGASFLARAAAAAALMLLGVTAPSASSPGSDGDTGQLRVWAPAGVVGDQYWLYVDGRIMSAPSRRPSFGRRSHLVPVKSARGQEFWGAKGLVFRQIRDAAWDPRYSPASLDAASRDALNLFQRTDLHVSSGTHRVELVARSARQDSAFPFAFSAPWTVTVRAGKTADLFLPLPRSYVDFAPAAQRAYDLCGHGAMAPTASDVDYLHDELRDYIADPAVIGLQYAKASLEPRRATTVIDFAAAEGGRRDYDAAQIALMAGSVRGRYNFPDRKQIASCRNKYPQFASAYDEIDLLTANVAKELETLGDLGGRRGGAP